MQETVKKTSWNSLTAYIQRMGKEKNERCARLGLHAGGSKGKMLQLFAFSGLLRSMGFLGLALTVVTHRDSH